MTRRSSTHISCAGQFVSRGFVVLLRKSNPQNRDLQTAAVRGVSHQITKVTIACDVKKNIRGTTLVDTCGSSQIRGSRIWTLLRHKGLQ